MLNSNLTSLNDKMFLNWYQLIAKYKESTVKDSVNTFDLRKLSKFNWLAGFIRVGGSPYLRGFAFVPTALFISHGALELTFLQGTTPYYADIIYVNDTTVEIAKNTSTGIEIYLYGISIGPVDFKS